ncbi:PAAR domain-containing protein [Aeromonas hydrophila]|uniref:PAAR domain-containing protein n=1 Tax=Aeromonas hydrophila TaxID=644 RepID=UPI00301868E2
MRNVARKGDPTSTGGVIQDGDGGWLTEGAPTTYIGMIATCPACKVGQGPIVAVGPRSIIGPGGPVALQGDYVACGCPPMSNTILPAQGTTVGDNQGPRARTASAPAETPAPAPASSPATPLVPLVDPTEHRIGIFFDGTQNNRYNSQLREQCEEASEAACKSIEKLIGTESSYDGGPTNIARLHQAYTGPAIYIEGIGTAASKADTKLDMAFGTGATGVIARSEEGLSKISTMIASLPAGPVAVDVFGFSRGAAAARHFVNILLESNLGRQVRVAFVGLFDTVAAIGLDTTNDDNAPVRLYIAPWAAEKVVQLAAQNEYRANFALNSVRPEHTEIRLFGTHSDIGGGYIAHEEKTPVMRPYDAILKFGDDAAYKRFKDAANARLQEVGEQYIGYVKDRSQIKPVIHNFAVVSKTDSPMVGYVANAIMTRVVKPELQLLSGHLMQHIAQESGAPINPIAEPVPGELAFLYSKYLDMWGGAEISLSEEQQELLMTEYVHCSDNWNPVVNVVYVNAPAPGRVRRVYQQAPGK